MPAELKALRNGTSTSVGPATDQSQVTQPRGLSAEAKREWRRVTDAMKEMGTMSRSYESALRLYIETYEHHRQLSAAVAEDGATLRQGSKVVRHPAWGALQKAADQMTRLLAELCLTPSTRSRIVPTDSQDELSAFDLLAVPPKRG